MGRVAFDISMSLDGFIAGPEPDKYPLGRGGESLHEWVFGLESWRRRHGMEGGVSGRDSDILEETFANVGAIVMGRNMFNAGEEPWGPTPPFHVPVFVVTHEAKPAVEKDGGTTFIFVNDGVDGAVRQAQAAAGDKDVSIIGGANVIQQALHAGLVDELELHVAPILLGGGVRLFDGPAKEGQELEQLRVVESPGVTHLKFSVK